MDKYLKFCNEYLKPIAIVLIIGFLSRMFVIQGFIIQGYSMFDSYYENEIIFIDKISYKLNIKDYNRGDVVTLDTEKEDYRFFLKRIIGLPGEKVIIENGNVRIIDKYNETHKLEEGYLNEKNIGNTKVNGSIEYQEYLVPEDSYFVMGDNRMYSTDSRDCFSSCTGSSSNYIKKDKIVGKVFLDLGYFNIKKFGFIHNEKNISTNPKFFNSVDSYKY